MKSIIIGLDIGKSVFQAHAEDCTGKIIIQKRLRRSQVEAFFARLPPSLVGIEACGSAHHWARLLRVQGHEVRLIPAAYVKPFVRRNKTDARDAAAICAALRRPDMRFVAIKSVEQRGLERSRELLVKQHTQLINCVRSQLAELGIVAAQGRRGFAALTAMLDAEDPPLPPVLVSALRALTQQVDALRTAIAALEKQIMAVAKDHPVMRRLAGIPGVGGLTAHAIVAAIGDGRQFGSARDFAAWCGLTPREHSSAGKRARPGHQSPGRHPAAQAVRARRQHHHAQRPPAHRSRNAMAARHPRPPAGEGGGAGAGGQDRPHRLGDPGLRRDLAASQNRRGLIGCG